MTTMINVCRRCNIVVNRLTMPDGTVEWVHGRMWEPQDHDPDPVGVPLGSTALSCDYCGSLGATWQHFGADVTPVVDGVPMSNFGPRWAACGICDTLAKRGDVDGLVKHASTSQAAHAAFGEIVEQRHIDFQRGVFEKYVPSIYRRTPVPPPPPPLPRLIPQRLPKIREKLCRLWEGELYRNVIAAPHPIDEPIIIPGADFEVDGFMVVTSAVPRPVADRFCDRMARNLRVADLYWVSPEFTALAISAGRKLPDLTLNRDEMPSPSGLIVFGQPIYESHTSRGLAQAIAISWVLVPNGIWVTLYAQTESIFKGIPTERLHEDLGFLTPFAPGSGLKFGTTENPGTENVAVWGTLLSTWFLMAQPGVGTIVEQPADRKARSRAARGGYGPPVVRLVDLRRQKQTAAVSGERTFHYSVRFLVGAEKGGFWRDQPYGPSRSLRKRIWVFPFMKGPADAPLKVPGMVPVVKVLK